jgi:hypothetical protein
MPGMVSEENAADQVYQGVAPGKSSGLNIKKKQLFHRPQTL